MLSPEWKNALHKIKSNQQILDELIEPPQRPVVTTEVEVPKLEFIYQFMYDNDPACEFVFDREMKENPKQDINDLMADIIDRNIQKHDRTRDCLLGATHRWMKITSRHSRVSRVINKVISDDKPKLWFITFTLEEDKTKTKEDLITRLNNARQRLLKKYKYFYVEEEQSAENKRYHQHVIVEGDYFHTAKNLRPADYYSGNINVKKVTTDNGIERYLTKENKLKGDVEHIKDIFNKYYRKN